MAIVSSSVIEDARQIDGRRWITERHIDQLALIYDFIYLASATTNAAAVMTARVAGINADLILREILANVTLIQKLGSLASPTLNYSTAAANFTTLRATYATVTLIESIMIGDYLSSLTDAQLQTAFGFTQAQVNTLRTNKLTPAATAANTIRAATGA